MINLKFDSNGLKIPTYEELFNDTIEQLKAKLGSDFYIDEDSPDYQIISIVLLNQYDLLLTIQSMLNSFFPSSAKGISLDRICSYQGIQRFSPTKSTATIDVIGTPGTKITGMIVADINKELWTVEDGTISELGTVSLKCESVNPGVYVGVGEIVNIVEAPKDVKSVTNKTPCIKGRLEETDAQLRIRRNKSILLPAVGTIDGLEAALININGVSNISIRNNDKDVPVDGVSPHSLAISILGGDDNEIAEVIYNKKSTGCGLDGTTEITLMKNNYPQTIKFYRPEYTLCKIQYTLTPLDNYASEYGEMIANNVKEYVSSLQIGQAITIGILYNIAYSVVSNGTPFNIKKIEMQVYDGSSWNIVEDKIPVAPINLLTLDVDGIKVVDGD